MADNTFSERMKELRKARGLTQEQVAYGLGVSPQAVSKWENGSYPDGDLIPRVAEFYHVSVSCLFGEDEARKPAEQQMMEYLRDISGRKVSEDGSLSGNAAFFEKVMNVAWAAQISPWLESKTYFPRTLSDRDTPTVAIFADNCGFEFMSLNRGSEFYTVLPEPEGGYAASIRSFDEMRRFFEMMGRPGALETLVCMLSLNNGVYVSVKTVADRIGKEEKTVQEVLEVFSAPSSWNGCITKISVLNGDGSYSTMYGVNKSVACLLLSIFSQMNLIIHPPVGYQMQIMNREKSWLDRTDISGMPDKKDGDLI